MEKVWITNSLCMHENRGKDYAANEKGSPFKDDKKPGISTCATGVKKWKHSDDNGWVIRSKKELFPKKSFGEF